MNEFELQRFYEAQLTAQVPDPRLAAHDRNAAAAVLAVSARLLGARLRPADESRTWVFSDPHFEHEASVAIFGRPFRGSHHGDGYLLEQWTRDVMDRDTVICLGDVTMGRPTDGLIDRLRRRPGSKVLVAGEPRPRAHPPPPAGVRGGRLRPPRGRPRPPLHPRAPGRRPRRLRERPRACPPDEVGGRAPDQRVRRADRVPASPRGRSAKAGPPSGRRALGRERHDRPLHRVGEGLAGRRWGRRTAGRAVSGRAGTAGCRTAAAEPRGLPVLEPDEALWLDGYLDRLKKVPGGLLKRLVVYGSKARGDAGLESDVDVLVVVGDAPPLEGGATGSWISDDPPGWISRNHAPGSSGCSITEQ